MKNIRDINESKINIRGKPWDHDDVRMLAAKQMLVFSECKRYWDPLLERGRKLEDYFEGKILTNEQKRQYVQDEKIVLEPPIAKAPIRALVGQAMKSRKSGQVVTERGSMLDPADNARELETINIVMKDIEIKTSEEFKITDAMMSALVSCYWNVIMFDKDRPSRNNNGVRYKMNHLPWGSCIFGPMTARKPDGSDIKELFWFDYRTIADLIDNYPDMEKQILDHFADDGSVDNKMLSSIGQWGGNWTAEERDRMFDVMQSAHDAKNGASMVQVVQRLFPVKKKTDVWINIFDDSGEVFETRPPDWDDERWNGWLAENPQYHGPYEREAIILWMTVFTTSGLVLANEAHWFQENGMLPCSFWVGAVDANIPTGPMVDMADSILANCVAEIEYLDDLRKGSGRLLVAREGAVATADTLHTEASKSLGVAFVSKDFRGPLGDALTEMVRSPNTAWKTYAEQSKGAMFENTRINETMLGEHAPRQSAIAKEAEISQALTVNARYIDNFNRSWDCHQSLKLKLIAYLYTEWETIEVMDDKTGDMQMVEVNAPESYDAEGNVASVINDLTAHRYRWRISPVDDSPTAKTRNLQDAIAIINGMAGPLQSADPSGATLAMALMACDNPMLQTMGKQMRERAEQMSQAGAQAEQQKTMVEQIVKLSKAKADLLRASKSGVITNFRAQDLSDYPQLHELWITMQAVFGQQADQKMQDILQMIAPPQEQEPISGQMMA
jgi:hypothetical protein